MEGLSRPLVSGVVRDNRGEAVTDARLFFSAGPEPYPDVAALSDEAGRFSLSVLSTGTYTLQCVAEGFSPSETVVEVQEVGAALEIELTRR
ncbi:MAG: carboxypeptidase-like regulatory domain-containing protein [Actinomycetota bacterium]|nr:carboxypeptidase-like regulatory domain-containing protein [Actinomycetota bacterium]